MTDNSTKYINLLVVSVALRNILLHEVIKSSCNLCHISCFFSLESYNYNNSYCVLASHASKLLQGDCEAVVKGALDLGRVVENRTIINDITKETFVYFMENIFLLTIVYLYFFLSKVSFISLLLNKYPISFLDYVPFMQYVCYRDSIDSKFCFLKI